MLTYVFPMSPAADVTPALRLRHRLSLLGSVHRSPRHRLNHQPLIMVHIEINLTLCLSIFLLMARLSRSRLLSLLQAGYGTLQTSLICIVLLAGSVHLLPQLGQKLRILSPVDLLSLQRILGITMFLISQKLTVVRLQLRTIHM